MSDQKEDGVEDAATVGAGGFEPVAVPPGSEPPEFVGTPVHCPKCGHAYRVAPPWRVKCRECGEPAPKT